MRKNNPKLLTYIQGELKHERRKPEECMALAIAGLADEIHAAADKLGLNNADTSMGAIEVLSAAIRDGCQAIGEGLLGSHREEDYYRIYKVEEKNE